MKKLLLISVIVLFIRPVNSQNGWQALSTFTSADLCHVYFVDENTGIMTTYLPVIYRSTNGGITWSQFTYSNPNIWFWGIDFINVSTGWVIGYSINSPYSNVILKTTNSGANWFEQLTGIGQSREVFFVNSQTGFVSGESFYKTTNAGTNWVLSNPPGFTSGLGLFFWDENTGWIGGNPDASSSIIATTSGGASWYSQLPFTGHVYSVKFTTAQIGFAAGPNGIIKSTNSGLNWTNVHYAEYGVSLSFINSLTGWALSQWSNPLRRKIMKTTDGGYSWVEQSYTDSRVLNYIFMLNLNTGWVVGDEGAIYKTTNGGVLGIQPVGNQIPDKFLLEQNYPNPFNPVTNIEFSIAEFSDVSLVIYDVQGRKVQTLVNSKLAAGNYKAGWDASKLPSGVYFYKLSAGNFSDSKKMILIK